MNENLKNVLTTFLTVLVLSGIGWLLKGSGQQLTPAQQAAVAQSVASAVDSALVQRAGSLTGPEIPSPYVQWGGVNHWAAGNVGGSDVIATTTSGTFCSILVPYGTSTIDRASFRPDNLTGIGGSAVFDISTSTLVNGSSTPALVIAASIGNAEIWTKDASSSNAAPNLVLQSANNTTGVANTFTLVSSPTVPLYLTFRIATTSGNTGVIPTTMAGNCSAEFTQI